MNELVAAVSVPERHPFTQGPWLPFAACVAVALPTMVAYNVPPSATFFNQALAFIGWGFLILLAATLPHDAWPRGKASLALLGALALLTLAALGSALFVGRPWTLALSEDGTIVSATLVVAVAAACPRRAGANRLRTFCIALVVAGVWPLREALAWCKSRSRLRYIQRLRRAATSSTVRWPYRRVPPRCRLRKKCRLPVLRVVEIRERMRSGANLAQSNHLATLLGFGARTAHSMTEFPYQYGYFLVPVGLWMGLVEASLGSRDLLGQKG